MLSNLADVSIRSLVLAAIAAAAVWFPRRNRSAAMEHAVWTAVAAGMLTLFVAGPALPKLPVVVTTRAPAPARLAAPPALQTIYSGSGAVFVPAGPVRVQAKPRSIDWSRVWSEAAGYLYASVASVFLLRFLVGMFLAWRLSARSIRVGGFFESAAISVPLAVGWFWPRILLPMKWREWDLEKLEAVLAHEGAHVRRRDGLVAALAAINRSIFWFHPLAWWLERRLGLLAELACDEACVAELGDRGQYAQLLLDMASVVDGSQGRLREQAFRMAARSHLRERIDSILKEGPQPSRGLKWSAWAAIAACGIPVMLGAGTVTLDREAPLALLLWLERSPFQAYGPPPPPPPRRLLAQVSTTTAAPGQRAQVRFEVASIRRAVPTGNLPPPVGAVRGVDAPPPPPPGGAGCFPRRNEDAGRVERSCVSLRDLLLLDVFAVPQSRLIAPDWANDLRFDISATLPRGATREQIAEMFQALLEDRFGLTFHRESKEGPVNALVVAKSGLKVKPAAPDSAQPAWVAAAARVTGPYGNGLIGGIRFRSISVPGLDGAPTIVWQSPSLGFVRRSDTGGPGGVNHYEAPSITPQGLAELAVIAGNGLDPGVVDMAGLTGRYQVNLDVSTADLIAMIRAAGPGDLTALQDAQLRVVQDGLKKLGLQLEPRRMPVETIVIDHLNKTPTEN